MSSAPGVPGGVGGAATPWRLIATLALVGAIAGFIWGVADRPLYESASTVLVEGKVTEDPSGLERLAAVGTSAEVTTLAASLLGGDVAGADLLTDVTIEPGSDGFSIAIVARSELPDFAAATADAFAEALVIVSDDAAKDGEGPISAGAPAEISSSPIENRSAPLWALIGLAAGLLAGSGAAMAVRWSRRHEPRPVAPREEGAIEEDIEEEDIEEDDLEEEYFEEEAEEDAAVEIGEPVEAAALEQAFGAPLLANLPARDMAFESTESGAVRLDGDAAEAFRDLADDLGLTSSDPPRTIAILDAAARDGADRLAAGVAAVAAAEGLRVVIVEADLDRPTLATGFGVAEDPGLRHYLAGEAAPRDVLRRIRVELDVGKPVSLVCVPAGKFTEGGVSTIDGSRFEALAERLPRVYDLVVFEAPPLLSSDDARLVARLVEANVLVAADEEASRSAIERSVRILAGETLVGGVLVR